MLEIVCTGETTTSTVLVEGRCPSGPPPDRTPGHDGLPGEGQVLPTEPVIGLGPVV